MNKATTINAGIVPKLKHRAETLLHSVALSIAEAIRIFYSQKIS